jgi:hypothetical protein
LFRCFVSGTQSAASRSLARSRRHHSRARTLTDARARNPCCRRPSCRLAPTAQPGPRGHAREARHGRRLVIGGGREPGGRWLLLWH